MVLVGDFLVSKQGCSGDAHENYAVGGRIIDVAETIMSSSRRTIEEAEVFVREANEIVSRFTALEAADVGNDISVPDVF